MLLSVPLQRATVLAALVALGVALAIPAGGGAAISGKRAKAFATQIAELGPRVAGSEVEREAGQIVADAFAELGYRVRRQAVPLPRGGRSLNVVARSPGPLRVIVVAHLDGVSGTDAANDNASGVAVLMELARALNTQRGLLLAAVGAEERRDTGSSDHLGSARLARGIEPQIKARVHFALSLDMVGVGARLAVRGIEAAPNGSSAQLLDAIRASGRHARYELDSGLSDHRELTLAGIPATWLQYRFDQACWHQPCDTANRLKTWKLRAAGRVAIRAIRDALAPNGGGR